MKSHTVVVIIALLVIAACGKASSFDAPYATFEYGGQRYEVSERYAGGSWAQAVAYCGSMGAGWRLPTLDEARAMRTDYEGGDPFNTAADCIESAGGELWTATGCEIGAYQAHRLRTV